MKRQRIRLHPVMPDLQNDLLHGRMNRREFLRLATLLGASLTQALQLAACSQTSPTTLSATPVATEALTINRGGTMKIGTDVQTDVDHPARLEWIHAANQFRQVAEYLTETDEHNITHPWLLERWEADEDVRTWTLFLRPGVTFNNGDPLTADDVIFTMNQWLDPDVKSSMRGLMSYLSPTGIERVDDATIRLHLDSPQIGLPEHLFHYPAMILHRHFDGNFVEQPIGTGPFLLDAYLPGERVVLKRRSDYWKQGSDGQALPYLDEIIYLHYNPEERVEAMQAGLIDSLLQPNPDDWQALQHVPGIQVYSIDTSKTLVLRMRVDREPWNDVRVRNALKLCQDRERILDVSFWGRAKSGLMRILPRRNLIFANRISPNITPMRLGHCCNRPGIPMDCR
ncbi:MAG: hypothetical protein HC837_14320 [Chloroflexaceae bacterium]|nr:hypothetical protein [Chloroflexaceae bacterium]